jgi:DNA mismatch endonuclease (patch repair protein)
MLHGAGYRYRLHDKRLPGRPDIVLKKHRTAIFVHGCFWHRHPGCSNTTTPSTRAEFWKAKFDGTVERDRRAVAAIKASGWRVITVWECELKREPERVLSEIQALLEDAA